MIIELNVNPDLLSEREKYSIIQYLFHTEVMTALGDDLASMSDDELNNFQGLPQRCFKKMYLEMNEELDGKRLNELALLNHSFLHRIAQSEIPKNLDTGILYLESTGLSNFLDYITDIGYDVDVNKIPKSEIRFEKYNDEQRLDRERCLGQVKSLINAYLEGNELIARRRPIGRSF